MRRNTRVTEGRGDAMGLKDVITNDAESPGGGPDWTEKGGGRQIDRVTGGRLDA